MSSQDRFQSPRGREGRDVTRVRVVVDPDPYWPLRDALVGSRSDEMLEPPLLPPATEVGSIVDGLAARVDGFVGFVSPWDRTDSALVDLSAEVARSGPFPDRQLVNLLIADPVKPTVTLVKGVRSLCNEELWAVLEPYRAGLGSTWEQLIATFDQAYVNSIADFIDRHGHGPDPDDLDLAVGGSLGSHLHHEAAGLCPPGWRVADASPLVPSSQVGTHPHTWAGLLVRCSGSARAVAEAALAGVGLEGLRALALAQPEVKLVMDAARDGPGTVAELHAVVTA